MQAYAATAAVVFILAAAGTIASSTHAQSQAKPDVPIKVTVTVGGRTETLRGNGSCGYAPKAAIHGMPAALWLAEYEDDAGRFVMLRHWQPQTAGAEAQFSLLVQSGTRDHRISTVKGSKLVGSGRSTLRSAPQGGRFEISGRNQNGAALQATLECARFTGIDAVGG